MLRNFRTDNRSVTDTVSGKYVALYAVTRQELSLHYMAQQKCFALALYLLFKIAVVVQFLQSRTVSVCIEVIIKS